MKSLAAPVSLAMIAVLASHTLSLHAEGQIDPDALFEQGRSYYEQSEYAQARTRFEKLVEIAPDVSGYHHWLGKCYGRIAENSGWLDAISFSKKTLKALEKAVELDGDNIAALEDLMTYYQQAPAFLGGSDKKARTIARHLQKLQDKENMTEFSGSVN